MKRWHEDYNVARREWRKHHKTHVESNKINTYKRIGKDPYEIDCICDEQIGRFRKTDAFDCRKVRCSLCHSDKFPKRTKNKPEIISDFNFIEQLKDFEQD